jgi:hypothetical protein
VKIPVKLPLAPASIPNGGTSFCKSKKVAKYSRSQVKKLLYLRWKRKD